MESLDKARPRKKSASSGNNKIIVIESNGNRIHVSDSGDSNNNECCNGTEQPSSTLQNDPRLAKRKTRIKKARARSKASKRSNTVTLFFVSSTVFVVYLLLCFVLFQNMPEGEEQQRRSGILKRLLKKTKEKLSSKIRRFNHDRNLNKGVNIPASQLPGIPIGKWPVTIRDEEGQFQEIKHPGYEDGHVTMLVPPFWADDPVAVHQKELMSRHRALSIGTCLTPDPNTGAFTRGDACPLNERTIFAAIASYRDWQCRDTVTSIFSRASHPERVRVAIVDQIVDGEDGSCDVPHRPCANDPNQPLCLYKNQLDVYQMDAALAVGPVFARHIGHRLYRGEYYSMQSDAHVTFTQGWDVDIIEQIEATGDEMAVLSTYLTDIEGSIDPDTGKSLRKTRPIMCNTEYEGDGQGRHLRHLAQPESAPHITGMSQLQPYWAAGFSFSRGHFIATVPYDMYQPMIFQGEEMAITLRGFTVGYDFFAPERSVCFHSYAIGSSAEARNRVPHFWEHADTFAGTGEKAMNRLLGIVNMNPELDPSKWNHAEEEKYGLGSARATSKFYELYGINVFTKTTERHLCTFVQNKMHNMFMPSLRSDGMGIDYTTIDFKWKDPRPNDP